MTAERPRRRGRSAAVIAAVGVISAVAIAGFLSVRSSGRTAAEPVAAPRGFLVLDTEPHGAAVILDGRQLEEVTPALVRGIAAGQHDVEFRLEGQSELARTLTIEAGERRVVRVVLPPPSRELHLRTVPSGAQVFLDRNLVAASTPATILVQAAEFQELRLEKSGFEPAVKHLTPEDTEADLLVTLELEKEPRGRVVVSSRHRSEVWIDGKFTGFETPTLGIQVREGTHTVQLRDANGPRSAPVEFVVGRGETVRMTLREGPG